MITPALLLAIAELTACVFSYWLASELQPSLLPAEDWLEEIVAMGVPGLVFWLQHQFRHVRDSIGEPWLLPVDNFLVGAGLTLVTQALLTYALVGVPLTASATILGSLFAAILITTINRVSSSPKRYLILGCDDAARALAETPLRRRLIGILADPDTAVPAGVRHLGGFDDLEEVIARENPDRVIFTQHLPVAARRLMEIRWAGRECTSAAEAYERYLSKVCAAYLRAQDVYMANTLFPFRPAMAIQAIYNNVLGLAVLIVLAPVLLAIALVIALSRTGPIFERTECVGVYRVPYRRLRFRIRDRETGRITGAGSWIRRLRLTRMPELINIVRGEQAFVGPPAVRVEHAARLMELFPLYFQRFSVKPGVLNWRGADARSNDGVATELENLESDLFYIKNSSLALDLETAARYVFGGHGTAGKVPAPSLQE